MNKLLIDLCRRLPYGVFGYHMANPEFGRLKLEGIDLSNSLDPVVLVEYPGTKSPVKFSLSMFRPLLKPMEPGITEPEAYEGGYDWLGLIEEGKAEEWKEEDTICLSNFL